MGTSRIAAVLVFAVVLPVMHACGVCRAGEVAKLFAEGGWSQPVSDADGYAVRGRLVLYERAVAVGGRAHFPRQDRREVAVYLELQDASDATRSPMRLFCDLGRADLRPENKSGLHCQLVDKDKRPVPPSPAAFGGGAPGSEWIILPSDATIRLRTSPFGISRSAGVAIWPGPENLWEIAENDAKEYFLSGTFTVDPTAAEAHAPVVPDEPHLDDAAAHVWRGTIALPAVRIVSAKTPEATHDVKGGPTSRPAATTTRTAAAAPDAIDALVAKLSSSHGLWQNGTFRPIDLPADASAERLVGEVFKTVSSDSGRYTLLAVVSQRTVNGPDVANRPPTLEERYTAVEVKTNQGPRIVLLRHMSSGGWWNRVYDVEPPR